MKQWYRFYTDNGQKLHQLGGEIPAEIAASVHLQPRLRRGEVPLPSQASTGAPGPWEECLGFSMQGNQKKSLTLHLESLLDQALRGKKWRKLKEKLLWQTAIL